jgi:uncharacterized RDD family membrane protein YckC
MLAAMVPDASDAYAIRTPENVVFSFALAGIGARALAWLVDLAVMGVLWSVVTAVAVALGMWLGGFAAALYFVFAFLVQWGYGAVSEWRWAGQTVGKRIVGLRVLSLAGTRVGFVQAVVRNLVRVVDLLPGLYLVGGCAALLDPHGRRLGDLAAGTVVVRERRAPRPGTLAARVDRDADAAGEPSWASAVGRVTSPERDAMISLCARRETLPLPVRYGLFARLARHLEARVGVRRPAHTSDERFVIQLTELALRPRDAGRTVGAEAR